MQAKNSEQITEIICPEQLGVRRGKRINVPLKRLQRQSFWISGEQDPIAAFAKIIASSLAEAHCREMIVGSERRQHWAKVEHLVGNVEGQDRIRTPEVL